MLKSFRLPKELSRLPPVLGGLVLLYLVYYPVPFHYTIPVNKKLVKVGVDEYLFIKA